MRTEKRTGMALLQMACIYMMATVVLGMFMAIAEDHRLLSVHSHLGLLGWMAMAVSGLVYIVIPRCDGTRLATAHFWLHNVGVPLMLASLAVFLLWGDDRAKPLIGIGGLMVVAGLLLFTINVFAKARKGAETNRQPV